MKCLALAVALVTVAVPGRILDTTTGQPLENVAVDVYAGSTGGGKPLRHVVTGSDGRFVLRGLRGGTYTLGLTSDDVPHVERVIRIDAARPLPLELHACSTTLDYSCVHPAVPSQPDSPSNG